MKAIRFSCFIWIISLSAFILPQLAGAQSISCQLLQDAGPLLPGISYRDSAFAGDEYGLLYVTGGTVYLARIALDGTILGQYAIVPLQSVYNDYNLFYHVIWTGNKYATFWYYAAVADPNFLVNRGIYTKSVTKSGTVSSATKIIGLLTLKCTATSPSEWCLNVVNNNDGYAVAWIPNTAGEEIKFAIFNQANSQVGTIKTLASTTDPLDTISYFHPQIEWSGSHYGVVFSVLGPGVYLWTYFKKANSSGNVVTSSVPFYTNANFYPYYRPNLFWNDANFVVTRAQGTSAGTDLKAKDETSAESTLYTTISSATISYVHGWTGNYLGIIYYNNKILKTYFSEYNNLYSKIANLEILSNRGYMAINWDGSSYRVLSSNSSGLYLERINCIACIDADGDGYNTGGGGCGTVDCSDTDAGVYPNAPELCDGIDNQCPSDPGYGVVDESCCIPTIEVCDGIDNNCNGQIDEGFDFDTDTYTQCGSWNGATFVTPNPVYVDCDNNNPNIHPGATEYCGNGIDENCNGQIDETGCTILTCNSCSECGVGWWNLCDEVECITVCNITNLCYFVPSGLSGDCYDCALSSLCSTYTTQSNCQSNPCNANQGSGGCMWDSATLSCVDAFEICDNNWVDDDYNGYADCADTTACCGNPSCTYDANCCRCGMFNSDSNGCDRCEYDCYFVDNIVTDECKECAGVACGDADELCVGDTCSMGCVLDVNSDCVGGGDVQPQPNCNLAAEWQDTNSQKVEVVGAGTGVKLVLTATGDCATLNGNPITFSLCSSGSCTNIGTANFDNGALTVWQATYSLVCNNPSYNCNPQTYHFKAFGASVIQSPNLYVVACDQTVDADCDGICNSGCDPAGSYVYCSCVEWDDGSTGDPCLNTQAGADTDETGCTEQQSACLAQWDCSNAKWSECDKSTNTRTRDTTKCVCTGDAVCCAAGPGLIPKTSSCLPEKPFPIFSWLNFVLVVALLAGYYIFKRKSF